MDDRQKLGEVERELRETARLDGYGTYGSICLRAADHIAALTGRNKILEEALEEVVGYVDDNSFSDADARNYAGQFARAALSASEDKKR